MHDSTSPASGDDIQQLAHEAMRSAERERAAGQPDQAAALYHGVLTLLPGHGGAHFGLALLAREAGRLADALPHFADALQADPAEEGYWLAYLDALVAARQFDDARELLDIGRRHGLQGAKVEAIAARLDPSGAPDAGAIDAAAALFDAGHLQAAADAARALCEHSPRHPFGFKLFGAVAHLQGRLGLAIEAMAVAAACAPDDTETLANLGQLLRHAGRLEEAEQVARQDLALRPDSAVAHNNLAVILVKAGRLEEALAGAAAARACDPLHAEAHNTLAVALSRLGRADEAVAAYREVLRLDPARADAHSNMLFCLSQMDGIAPAVLFEEHRRFGEALLRRVGARQDWPNSRDPERPLRVDFVSGDLRHHAVISFLEPVLARLSGRPGLSLFAYHTNPHEDATSARLRGYMAAWHQVAALDDDALDALVRRDGIDILVDLSGHTAHNRLAVFARKPAPLQATWIGYPFSTGLATIDYYVTDRVGLPPGQYDHLFIEKLLHLPVTAPFQPVADAPDLVAPPMARNGYLSFGSFNRLSKISRQVVAAWSRILRGIPDARLLLAGMPEGGGPRELLAWFAEEGIDAARLRFHPRTGMRDYLALHNEVDLNLDTFPYSGGTTTLHALWMGVPTLTIAGDTPAGRQSATILRQNGIPQYACRDVEQFVERALTFPNRLEGITVLREKMRARMAAPTPEIRTRVADGVELALRMMWRRWCAGLPAESFEAVLQPAAPAAGA